ncbi:hypothetical protein BSKO_06350 [Bryopsis sp. KO-2023]|nr:hypothetical protein BSKO_06350 [Bryopsis sp. KO-2023]
MFPSSLRALQNAASTCQTQFVSSSAVSLRKCRSLSLQPPRTFQVRDSHRWTVSRTMRATELDSPDKGESDAHSLTPRRMNEGTSVSLIDIPKGMRTMLVYKCMRQPVQIIIGKKGVDRGLLNCLQMHFRTHEVVRCRVARQWKDCVADLAQELEEKSGGVIIERVGSRICLFRGYTHSDIPRREPNREGGWWSTYQNPPKKDDGESTDNEAGKGGDGDLEGFA